MSVRTRLSIFALALLATPGALFAHEGHGLEASIAGLLHWLLEPTHLAGTVLFLVFSAVIGFGIVRSRRTRSEGV